jgi:hypothetical protein
VTSPYHHLRRFQLPVVLLTVLLQRAPLLRTAITTEFVVTSGLGSVLKGVLAGSAVMLSETVHAQTGATPTRLDPGPAGLPARATVGVPFGGGFAITGAPATARSYEITGQIPPGLSVLDLVGDTVNGVSVSILGTPTQAGEYTLQARAWRGINKTLDGGDLQFDYTIVVAEAVDAAPVISGHPTSRSISEGASVTFSVTAEGNPVPAFQWRKDGVEIAGATEASFVIPAVSSSDAGDYTVVVNNSLGSITSNVATLTIADTAISIISAPVSIDVGPNSPGILSVVASASTPLSYQWFRFQSGEGLRILSGQTSPTLNLPQVTASDMGFYYVRIASADETIESDVVVVTVKGGTSRLANLSTRGSVPAGGELTPGFVLRGDGAKDLVIRAVGPELADFGVSTAMADPTLALVPLGGTTPMLTNDNWEDATNASQLATTSGGLGAFPLDADSRDAAVLSSVSLPNSAGSKGFTVQITSTSGAAGIALAEIYDPDGASMDAARLTNISARGFSGLGAEVLAPGFVIDGDGAKTMLIRVVGPTLAGFGVPGTMADPQLEVIPGGQNFTIARNDNWGGTTELKEAYQTTGAFSFADDASLDAAVLVRLPPGAYTVRPTGANDGTGVILVEAYEVLSND